MPKEAIQKIRKVDKFFVNGKFIPIAARLITAAHDAYFWVDDSNIPHWAVITKRKNFFHIITMARKTAANLNTNHLNLRI